MKRIFLTVCIVGVILSGLSPELLAKPRKSSRNRTPFSDKAVEKAIKSGIAFLWGKQKKDGSWIGYGPSYPVGPTALAAYALLECGISPQEPRMAKALNWLAKHPTKRTYSLGIVCNVWLAAAEKDRKFLSLLRRDSLILIKSTGNGAYSYVCDSKGRSGARRMDNSASQYGVLGVWAAARGGEEVPREYWSLVGNYWMGCQNGDGGWSYCSYRGASAHLGVSRTRSTMVAAGLASLFVCYDNLLSGASSFTKCRVGKQAILSQKPIARGLKWFDKNFRRSIGGLNYYYFYGIERVGLASGYKYFGKADWYKIIATKLLRGQSGSGAWTGQYTPEVATSFALLFMVRGRNAVLFNKLQFHGDWNNRPRDLATLTRWISKTFEDTVNWQIINMSVPVEEWHDAPILYISGSQEPVFNEDEIKSLRNYVHQGGTIFSVTECKGKGFKNGIRGLYKKLFPQYKLTQCPANHPLYDIRYRLGGKPTMYVVSNGVRPLVVHVDEDLSLHWQLQAYARRKWAFEAAVNVFMYVTDKGSTLRRRGTTLWPKKAKFKPEKTIKIARLKYKGNYNPEPLAFSRFALQMGLQHKIKVDVPGPIAISQLAKSKAKLAILSGTGKFELTDTEKTVLKQFTSSGGTLLLEAAGGDPGGIDATGFMKSAKKLIREMYPDEYMDTLAGTAEIYNLPGMKIDKVRWRRGTKIKIGTGKKSKEPRLKAIVIKNRPAIIFSQHDITAGLLGATAYTVFGYYEGNENNPGTAFRLMRNIAVYSGK